MLFMVVMPLVFTTTLAVVLGLTLANIGAQLIVVMMSIITAIGAAGVPVALSSSPSQTTL